MAKQTASSLDAQYLELIRANKGDLEGRAQGQEYLSSTMQMSEPLDWTLNPYLLDEEQYAVLSEGAATMSGIMEKVMAKYHRDRSFRALFGLPKAVEELTLVPSGCRAAVPLARLDLFFDRSTGDYQFCGIATGAVDGMAASIEATRAVQQSKSWHEFSAKHASLESFDAVEGCVDALLHTYEMWANAQEGHNHPTRPSMAVLDYAGSSRHDETDRVISRLRARGCYAHATEPGELRLAKVDGADQLVDNHGPLTCVWVRPTAEEIVADMGTGVKALIEATRHGWVCTIGGYRSWPCCTRAFLSVLRTKECRLLLTRTENAFVEAHVPQTYLINPASDLSLFYDQENWVLKVADGHQADSMIAGRSVSRSAWRKRLVKAIKLRDAAQPYLMQQPAEVFLGSVAEGDDPCVPVERNVMVGLFLFDGSLKGVRATCGVGDTIADWERPCEMGCLLVHE